MQTPSNSLRDVVALIAFNAAWIGRTPQEIADSLAAAQLTMLDLEFVYVRLSELTHEDSNADTIEAVLIQDSINIATQKQAIIDALALKPKSDASDLPRSITSATGCCAIQIAASPIGVEGTGSLVIVGAQRAGFPTEYDRLMLSIAANETTTAIQGARLLVATRETEQLKTRLLDRERVARTEAEEALLESQERFHSYFELGLIGMAITSPDKGFVEVNDELCRILGYERDEILKLNWDEITDPGDVVNDVAQFNRVMAKEIDGYTLNKRWIRGNGQILASTISVKCVRRADGTVDHFITLLQDITEHKRVTDALRQANDELEDSVAKRTHELSEANTALRAEIAERKRTELARQQLMEQIVIAQEEERRRISRELHDSIGQYVIALNVGLKSLQDRASRFNDPMNGLQTMRDLVSRLDQTVDQIILELRPPLLDDLGLEAALRLLVKEWSTTNQILMDLHVSQLDHERLPATLETTIYRIVQEALTNIVKHAHATRVSLIIERRDREVHAIIEDDGIGFEFDAASGTHDAQQRLGIIGMQERAALAGGRLDIETAPGVGTTVYLSVPIFQK